VICKKSAYQRLVKERRDRRIARLVRNKDPSVARYVSAHREHQRTIELAKQVLRDLGARTKFRSLSYRGADSGYDLVVTLGGDGTFLWASHVVGPTTPMLGVNTSPADSVGYFCAAHPSTLEGVLSKAVEGRLPRTRVHRMQVEVDGDVVSRRVLNDALFCDVCAAATSRYLIEHRGIVEDQKSSGVWVGPAAGSTAAQRSAGGSVLPIRSKKLQYVVREPYPQDGVRYRLIKGLVDDSLRIRNKTVESRLYLDGPHREHSVKLGSVVDFRRSPEPLLMLGEARARTRTR
jgi:NAD+ kinase